MGDAANPITNADLESAEFRRALRSQYRDLTTVVQGTPLTLGPRCFRLRSAKTPMLAPKRVC
jgi:hypothetical protein